MLQWRNWPDGDLHSDRHGAEPYGQRWSVFFFLVCVCNEVVKQFTVFCLNWTGCSIPTGVKEIDIAATLEHVRDQRPGMVRTKVVETTSSCYFLAVKFEFNFMPTCFCNVSLLSISTSDFNPSHKKTWLRVWPLDASDWLSVVSCCLQDQFEFALTAVAEEVNAILKALPQWNQEVRRLARTTTKPLQLWLLHLLSYLSFS